MDKLLSIVKIIFVSMKADFNEYRSVEIKFAAEACDGFIITPILQNIRILIKFAANILNVQQRLSD